MNEQQRQILEDRVSDALLAPLTDEQLAQLDKLMDNPATTEDQVEGFIRMAGVDIEGITRKITEDFVREQGIATNPASNPQETNIGSANNPQATNIPPASNPQATNIPPANNPQGTTV